jgi:hypothetical protein
MDIDITPVVIFALGLIFGALSKLAEIVGLRFFETKQKTPQEWTWLIDDLIDVGVKAAEQVWRGEKDAAKKKLEYAYNYVTLELKRNGVRFDDKLIYARIEAKVYELFHRFEEPVNFEPVE